MGRAITEMFNKIRKVMPNLSREREDELLREIENGGGIERGDMAAMIFSAYLTVMPIVTLLLSVFLLMAYLYTN